MALAPSPLNANYQTLVSETAHLASTGSSLDKRVAELVAGGKISQAHAQLFKRDVFKQMVILGV